MEKKRIIIENLTRQPQLFGIDEYDDHIEIGRLLSKDIEEVYVSGEINGKPVTVIKDECFFNEFKIRSITLPEGLKKIGCGAFALCKGIHEFVIPDSVEEIGTHAFRDCTGLAGGRVVMPQSLRVLDHSVFAFCYMDGVKFELKEGLEVIRSHAFYSAGAFDLIIPESVKMIQPGAFANSNIKVKTSLPYREDWFE